MSWEIALLTSATAFIADLLVGLAKKSPPFLLAPYLRLWEECALLHRILHNERFSNWKPQAARYVALRAIKAQGVHQESPQPVLDLLEIFLKRNEPVVLLGEPGAGKTTALEALTFRLARRALLFDRLIWLALLIVTGVLSVAAPILAFVWLASFIIWEPFARRFTVPVFIEARSDYSGGDVNEWREKIFKDRFGAKPLLGSRGRFALFIDGVNEIQASMFGGFVEGWRARLRGKHASRIIFTSRGGEENPSQRLSVESVLSVCDLEDDGVREFLRVYGREKAADEKKPYNVEQATNDFGELQKKNLLGEGSIGRNPYWLKMIVESGLYTVNRGALFRTFAEKLIRREIEEKPEERKRKPDWKPVPLELEMDALAAVALVMHEEKRIGFSDETGWEKARAAIRERIGDLRYSPDDVLSEGLASTLLRVQFKKRIEFVHQLVQEFYAAYALHPESRWQEVLGHCEDVWWWQTLFLIGGLVGGENVTRSYCEFVRKILNDGSNEQRVFAAIGLLRSVENTPSEPSISIVEAFGVFMEKNLILRAGATTLNLTEAQQRAIEELTRTLGEEAAEAFAMLLEDSRLTIQIIGILILSIVGGRRAAELLIKKLNDTSDEFVNDSINRFVGIGPLVRIGEPAVDPLIQALRDDDENVRRCAADALGEIGDARAVGPLIAALRDADKDVALDAVLALAEIGSASVEPLIAILRDKDWNVRTNAANALGLIGDAQAVAPIIAAFQDEDWRVRSNAAFALERIGTPAVSPLIGALHSSDSNQRPYLVAALRQIGGPSVAPLMTALRDQVAELRLSRDNDRYIPLKWERRLARNSVIRWLEEKCGHLTIALETIGEPVVDPLIGALQNDETGMRWRAAQVLGRIRSERAVEPLIRALQDEDQSVRKCAADALGRIADVRAVDALSAARQDTVPDVSSSAERALTDLSDRRVSPLIDALLDSETEVPANLVDALLQVGTVGVERFVAKVATMDVTSPRKVMSADLAYFKDLCRKARWRAADVFKQIGEPAVKPLIALAKGPPLFDPAWVAAMLEEIGSPSVGPLIAILEDVNEALRGWAAEVLGRIGDARAVEVLSEALTSTDDDLRKVAASALGQIGDARALTPLKNAAKKDRYRSDPGTVVNEAEDAINRVQEHQEQKEGQRLPGASDKK